jgi:hypothetical protein
LIGPYSNASSVAPANPPAGMESNIVTMCKAQGMLIKMDIRNASEYNRTKNISSYGDGQCLPNLVNVALH